MDRELIDVVKGSGESCAEELVLLQGDDEPGL
jgi:hypothetical protein